MPLMTLSTITVLLYSLHLQLSRIGCLMVHRATANIEININLYIMVIK